MNPIHQSLSVLLRNPAFQADAGTRRAGENASESAPAASESFEVSSAARQSLARSNAAAALPAVSDLAEAESVTRLVRDALTGGGATLAAAHRELDPRAVGSLLQ